MSKAKLEQVTFICPIELNGKAYKQGDVVAVDLHHKKLLEKHGFIKGEQNEPTNQK